MKAFAEYLNRIENPQHRAEMEGVLHWVGERFPMLSPRVAWNQPMFTDHGTFIIGFSAAKEHFAVAPEKAALHLFSDQIEKAGYSHGKELIRFPWGRPVDFGLLERMIEFNIQDKASCQTFWRK